MKIVLLFTIVILAIAVGYSNAIFDDVAKDFEELGSYARIKVLGCPNQDDNDQSATCFLNDHGKIFNFVNCVL